MTEEATLRTGPTIRQKVAALAALRKLVQAGQVTKETPTEELEALLTATLLEADKELRSDPTVNWESLFAFVLKYLPLILAIFGL